MSTSSFACLGEDSAGLSGTETVSVRVDLSADDIGLTRIRFEVSGGPLAAPVTGEVQPIGDTVSFTLSVLPVGTDYELALFGFNADDEQVCVGGAGFSIVEGETRTVDSVLACTTSETTETGSLDVDSTLTLNICPAFDAVWASANVVYVGEPVEVGAIAHDMDEQPEPLVYAWSETSTGVPMGTFTDPAEAVTTFTCTLAGEALLRHALNDGDPACNDSRQLSVTCLAPRSCGNGTLEGTEACDDGNVVDGDGCSGRCALEPICGNGTLEGTEACDDGNVVDGDGCSSLCAVEP